MKKILLSLIVLLLAIPNAFADKVMINVSGQGYVSSSYPYWVNCDSQCNIDVAETITLKATGYGNSEFVGWSGACSGSEPSCTISGGAITAIFSGKLVKEYSLTVQRNGEKGTISSDPSGIYVGSTFSYDYTKFAEGTKVILTAIQAEGAFKSWTGCSSVDGNVCTVLMESDKIVTAEFEGDILPVENAKAENKSIPSEASCGGRYEPVCDDSSCSMISGCSSGCKSPFTSDGKNCVVVQESSYFTLQVTTKGPGTVTAPFYKIYCGKECSAQYHAGDVAELTAYPEEGALFIGWQGDCSGNLSCNLVMNGSGNVTAVFKRPVNYTLKVAISGLGKVSGANIDCGNECSIHYPEGTLVLLQPHPGQDNYFKEWKGCLINDSVCAVMLDSNKTIKAIFEDIGVRRLNLSINGKGKVFYRKSNSDTLLCSSNCTRDFQKDEKIMLIPKPGLGYVFKGWEKGCSGSGNCSLSMNSHLKATAIFVPRYNVLIFVKGNGTVKSKDGLINCGDNCAVGLMEGNSIDLVAIPNPDSEFMRWRNCSSEVNECRFTALSRKRITAEFFTPTKHSLNVEVNGQDGLTGRVIANGMNCNPVCRLQFRNGTKVTLEAVPEKSLFKKWGGECSGAARQCIITMDSDKKVSALFGALYNLSYKKVGNGLYSIYLSGPTITTCEPAQTCSYKFSAGEKLKIQVLKTGNTVIHNVSGACSSIDRWGECRITMDSDKELRIDSTLTVIPLRLDVSKSGEGTVETFEKGINCGEKCSTTINFKEGTVLYAKPAQGWEFDGWESNAGTSCSGNKFRCIVVADDVMNYTVKAKFARVFRITVEKYPVSNLGIVKSEPPGIKCDSWCSLSSYRFKGDVWLVAESHGNNAISRWEGCDYEERNTCYVNPKNDLTVRAYFESCTCGEIKDNVCVRPECCDDSHCNMYQKCNKDSNKCVEKSQCFGYDMKGLSSDKLDLVVIGDGFTSTEELGKEIRFLFEESESTTVFDISPFKENRNKFNIWMRIAPDLRHDKSDIEDMNNRPNNDHVKELAATCPREATVVISKQRYRSFAYPPSAWDWGGTVFLSMQYGERKDLGKTFAHELGHAIGGLADEYTEANKGSNTNFVNCAGHAAGAMLLWGDLAGKDGVGYYTAADDPLTVSLKIRKDPDGGCSYEKTNVRPTITSLMRDYSTDKFGPVNERELKKKLGGYK